MFIQFNSVSMHIKNSNSLNIFSLETFKGIFQDKFLQYLGLLMRIKDDKKLKKLTHLSLYSKCCLISL